MEPFELSPMALIQAQREKIIELVDENLQFRAAVAQLQQHIVELNTPAEVPDIGDVDGEVSVSDDPTASITDITDEMVGAEVTS